MKAFLLCGLVVLASVPVWAGNDSPVPTIPGVAGPKWSLTVLQPHVATGGFPGAEHHTEFVVKAIDAKGVPLKGIMVELPTIWGGKNVLADTDPKYLPPYSTAKRPRVEWHSNGKTTVTDDKGEAHGLFTSGGVEMAVTLHGPGDTRAKIEQVWNESSKEKRFGFHYQGDDTIVRYSMGLSRDGKLLPITGHRLKFLLDSMTLVAYRPTGQLDENGQPEYEEKPFDWKIEKPKENASPKEKACWETVLAWTHLGEMREVEPGIYEGTRSFSNFSDDPPVLLDGMRIVGIGHYNVPVQDLDCFGDVDLP